MQVEDRTVATLMPVIQQFIKPGSTVISDQWAAYSEIGPYGYQHLTVTILTISSTRVRKLEPKISSVLCLAQRGS